MKRPEKTLPNAQYRKLKRVRLEKWIEVENERAGRQSMLRWTMASANREAFISFRSTQKGGRRYGETVRKTRAAAAEQTSSLTPQTGGRALPRRAREMQRARDEMKQNRESREQENSSIHLGK